MGAALAMPALLGAGCLPRIAQAASDGSAYPNRPITLIVPWPPGGGTDLTIRVLAEEASARLGQPVVVVNRPGAAGTMVAPLLKAANPDGYTIGQLPITVLRFALMNRVTWDPLQDLQPILQVSGTTFGLLVQASSPWQTVKELFDWAKQHPHELKMGSTGIGSTPHLAMDELLQQNGIEHVHVPYKGTADQMLALAAGTITAGMTATGFAPWVEQGKLRLLAIFGDARSARWPQVPTLRELGYPQAVYNSPWGLAAPAGTPAGILNTLHDAFKQAMHAPRHLAELARYDQDLSYLDTPSYKAALVDTMATERRLLQRMKLLAPTQP